MDRKQEGEKARVKAEKEAADDTDIDDNTSLGYMIAARELGSLLINID